MSSPEKELEEKLTEAGNNLLLQPPDSVHQLLPLLDQVENLLSRVEQSPAKSTHDAVSPSMKALVADELLRHSDVDVKVAVASCISEITRITAPEAPYDDEQMKDVFRLIVSSFESLSNKSSRSYDKRTLILETVAKVRSCVVMLDLECDGLIVEMFQHFLKAIRDYHPDNVFSSMETIMTLLLEESEDIPLEMLKPILACVKKDNEEVLPIARKLGKRVLENCAVKLKLLLPQAVRLLGASLDDYSKVVASLCQGTSGPVELNGAIAGGEQLADDCSLARAASAAPVQVAKESVIESCPEAEPGAGRSPKPIISNGVIETANDGAMVDPESLKKQVHDHLANQSVDSYVTRKANINDSDAGKSVKPESKQEQTAKRRGRKPITLINSNDPSDSSRVDREKEAEKLADCRKSRSKDIRRSPGEDPSVEEDAYLKNEKETGIQLSVPKALESEAISVASPCSGGNLPDEDHPKEAGQNQSLIQEDAPSDDVMSKKLSEVISDSEVKPQKRSGKKATVIACEDRIPTMVETSQNENETTSDSEAKPLERSGKKVDSSNDIEDKSLSKKKEGRTHGRRKPSSENDETKSSAKDDDDEMVYSLKSTPKSAKRKSHFEETPKTNPKRKRTFSQGQTLEYGKNLVGSKVKVWWPRDREFYKGVIQFFDPVKKKHKVLYVDGDVERLNLRREQWEFIEGDSDKDGEQATGDPSHDSSSDMRKRKKTKMYSEPSTNQEMMDASPERGRAVSSSKSNGTFAKSGHKSSYYGNVDNKSNEDTFKASGKSEDDTGDKSKDRSRKSSGKSVDDAPKSISKSKDVDGGIPKATTKFKQDTPKAFTKSRGTTRQSGNKSSVNGVSKVKSNSLKGNETGGVKGKSIKTPESVKGKSTDMLKARESEAKSGVKRRTMS